MHFYILIFLFISTIATYAVEQRSPATSNKSRTLDNLKGWERDIESRNSKEDELNKWLTCNKLEDSSKKNELDRKKFNDLKREYLSKVQKISYKLYEIEVNIWKVERDVKKAPAPDQKILKCCGKLCRKISTLEENARCYRNSMRGLCRESLQKHEGEVIDCTIFEYAFEKCLSRLTMLLWKQQSFFCKEKVPVEDLEIQKKKLIDLWHETQDIYHETLQAFIECSFPKKTRILDFLEYKKQYLFFTNQHIEMKHCIDCIWKIAALVPEETLSEALTAAPWHNDFSKECFRQKHIRDFEDALKEYYYDVLNPWVVVERDFINLMQSVYAHPRRITTLQSDGISQQLQRCASARQDISHTLIQIQAKLKEHLARLQDSPKKSKNEIDFYLFCAKEIIDKAIRGLNGITKIETELRKAQGDNMVSFQDKYHKKVEGDIDEIRRICKEQSNQSKINWLKSL